MPVCVLSRILRSAKVDKDAVHLGHQCVEGVRHLTGILLQIRLQTNDLRDRHPPLKRQRTGQSRLRRHDRRTQRITGASEGEYV